jgi:8-oxo-dGTP pyrophosphatase MutT (NUDIX family)
MSTVPTNGETDSTVQLIPFENGSHNSANVIITSDLDRSNFRERLQHTIDACRSQHKTSLWVEVPMSCASLIEDMQDFGLEFHHAQGTTASLNVWLDESKTNKIPEFATHHVGVGALVVNSRNEILCVRELRHNFRPWKLPGGLSDLGEDIPQAACREVLEETGIECKFQSILSFRHTHGMANGRSDLYFVCRLEPIESVDKEGNVIIPEPVACEEEIEACAWVPLQEYRYVWENVAFIITEYTVQYYSIDLYSRNNLVSLLLQRHGQWEGWPSNDAASDETIRPGLERA